MDQFIRWNDQFLKWWAGISFCDGLEWEKKRSETRRLKFGIKIETDYEYFIEQIKRLFGTYKNRIKIVIWWFLF